MFVFLHLQIYKNNKHVILPDSFFLYFILKALWFCHNLPKSYLNLMQRCIHLKCYMLWLLLFLLTLGEIFLDEDLDQSLESRGM